MSEPVKITDHQQHSTIIIVGKERLQQPDNNYTSSFEGLTDRQIWQSFQQGDDAAFVFIYKQYFSILYRFGSQFTRSRELIKDCIQDLFIELNEKREKITIVSSIRMYLFKSLKNKILAYQKKQLKLSLYEDMSCGFDFYFDFSIEHTMIHNQIDEEKKEKLNLAVQKLTSRQREIIYYYYHEGLSFGEVRELMDLQHVKSAQNLLYKTVSVLKQQVSSVLLVSLLKYGFTP